MLRYSEASGSSDAEARSFGVPQDDNSLLSRSRFSFHASLSAPTDVNLEPKMTIIHATSLQEQTP